MLFWDKGFERTPEERVGALVWRMHRSARVIFTMNFHLGKWTPQQCVQFLDRRRGLRAENATAEVRRSFDGSVGPLYQCAYLMGALQFRAMHQELVDSKKMTDREFHDAILHENAMPIEMLRADLERQKLTRDFKTSWKFYGDHPTSSLACAPHSSACPRLRKHWATLIYTFSVANWSSKVAALDSLSTPKTSNIEFDPGSIPQ